MGNKSVQEKFNTPTIFVIFGGTGDLARKKLFPSLFDLYRKGRLPDACHIVGVAHSDYDLDSFRKLVSRHLADDPAQAAFLDQVSYVRGSFDAPDLYGVLETELKRIDDQIGQCSNKLFHLSVSPRFYEPLLENLHKSGLAKPCDEEQGWTRVLIEKPFGNDLKSARTLDGLLARLFKEEQIYRIDHYLAKETIQNIIMFRFANILFTPVWNANYIESIEIKLHEKIDVDTRGKFYDGIGALRDVGQNHLLQMFSLIAMDNPGTFDAAHIRKQRASVLERTVLSTDGDAVQGQYKGYREIDSVDSNSKTETYFRLGAKIDSDKWRGTKFRLSAGKALQSKCGQIIVIFKEPDPCLCDETTDSQGQYNKIIFDIQPAEKITVRFFAKSHGFKNSITPKDFTFSYHDEETVDEIDAYERVLHDAIIGDQMLFTSTEEVVAAWEAMMPVLEKWQGEEPTLYPKGSDPSTIKST